MVTAKEIAEAQCVRDALAGVAAVTASAYAMFMTVSETVLRMGDLDKAELFLFEINYTVRGA